MIDTQDDRKVAECHSSGRSVALKSRTLVLLLLAVCCLESRAYGWVDVVIDDFDQSATLLREKLVGPDHFRDPVLVSPHDARRDFYFFGPSTKFDLLIDSNTETEGELTIEIENLIRLPSQSGGMADITISYHFWPPVDLLGASQNNAFALDFSSIESSVSPSFARVFFRDENNEGFGAWNYDLPLNSESHTELFPFDAFVARGGTVEPRLDRIKYVSFSFLFFDAPAAMTWNASIQRFRTTRIVPEPSGISFIATICFLIFWMGYARADENLP